MNPNDPYYQQQQQFSYIPPQQPMTPDFSPNPPPGSSYMPPTPHQSSHPNQGYSAYPETHSSPAAQNYQMHVKGLRGWNDPPKDVFQHTASDDISGLSDASNQIVSRISNVLNQVKSHPVLFEIVMN